MATSTMLLATGILLLFALFLCALVLIIGKVDKRRGKSGFNPAIPPPAIPKHLRRARRPIRRATGQLYTTPSRSLKRRHSLWRD